MLDGWVSAAFGTADPQRFERCFAAVHQSAVQQFPPLPNALALTSPRIQAHLAAQGKSLPLVGEALSQLAEQGCRRVAVNSLLLAEGAEWDKLRSQVEQRRADFDPLILIPPLLCSRSQACAQTLDALFPAEPGLTRVLLGHGCAQGANSAYAVLQTQLRAAGRDDLSIALLHGDPSLGELLEKWNQSGARRIELNFLMLCAGHHAQEVRRESRSWAATYPALSVTISDLELGSCPAFQELFLSFLKETSSNV